MLLLERSVRSILEQSIAGFELLICDDGSSPEAKRFLDQLASEDERVRLIRPGDRIKLAEKLNTCLAQARAPFLARMDDDDYSCPVRFKMQLDALYQHPEIAFVGSCVRLCQDGRIVGKRSLPVFPQIKDFYMTQPFIHPALMFRREALESVGGYNEAASCELCEDYDLLLRLYTAHLPGMNLPNELLDYTVPSTPGGSRTMHHRWNEAVTRWKRFKALHLLPKALPFVIKPIVVGLVPKKLLWAIKKR